MTDLYELFQTDKGKETAGIKLNFGECTMTILRAYSLNKKYMKELRKHASKYEIQLKNGLLDGDIDNEIMAKVYSKAIVVAWSGVKDAEGKHIPFTPEACEKILLDLPDLLDFLKKEAERSVHFKMDEMEKEKKSSLIT